MKKPNDEWNDSLLNVFLVDDDEDDYRITRDMLAEIKGNQFTLEWVTTYDEALEIICNKDYDVCLIDYRLGEHSGLELLKAAINNDCKPPLILMTGLDDRDVDMEAMQFGAADYLVKGQITAPLLERSIRYAIAQKRVIDNIRDNERRRELFVATLTHDLKTPVRAEYRVLELLKKGHFGPMPDTFEAIIEELLKSNRYMHRIVDNLVTTYKYEDSPMELNRDSVDINAMILEILETELKVLVEEKNHQLQLYLDTKLPLLSLDPHEIRRVLYNLIHNAIAYTDRMGQIIITSALRDKEVYISIQDNGPGIEPERLDQIFIPYNAMSKRFRHVGTGLGLYLSKRIVETHGGELHVVSEVNHGSTFSISLPILTEAVSASMANLIQEPHLTRR